MTTTEAMPAMIKGTIFRLLQQAALVHRAMANHKREQVQLSQKNLEIADVGVRETLTATSRSVRNAYWELAYQIAALQVARQSLELAEESLRNTRSRIEIGTTPPIDAVEADAEVATRREAVIVAEAQIETAQDTLRALVYNPSMPDFWTIRIEPADMPSLDR
jgi:outer membrane protein TolC